jgi:hypothetical protein
VIGVGEYCLIPLSVMVLVMFERWHEELLPRQLFLLRMAKFTLLSLLVVTISLLFGIAGYVYFEGMPVIDAFLNSAMLMGGMGPVGTLHTVQGKLFAGFYALYCGFILLISLGIFIAPIFHRLMHHFQIEQ